MGMTCGFDLIPNYAHTEHRENNFFFSFSITVDIPLRSNHKGPMFVKTKHHLQFFRLTIIQTQHNGDRPTPNAPAIDIYLPPWDIPTYLSPSTNQRECSFSGSWFVGARKNLTSSYDRVQLRIEFKFDIKLEIKINRTNLKFSPTTQITPSK